MNIGTIGIGISLFIGVQAASIAPGSIEGTVGVTETTPIADAVVYVQQTAGTFTPKPAVMDQRGMKFVPSVLPIVIGSTVHFLNSDPLPHVIFSPNYEKFALGVFVPKQEKDQTFGTCSKFPCVYSLLCPIHPEMEASVIVLQNPFFAVTDKNGHYEIPGVPSGVYMVRVWGKNGKAPAKSVTVESNKSSTSNFVIR